MLRDTRALVSKAAQEGKSPAQMKSEHILAKYEELGKDFIKTDAWIDVLYTDVTGKNAAQLPYRNHGHTDEHPSAPGN
jgi:hypothetical protein